MSEAPERIWVSERPTNHSLGACHVYKLSHADEYVRADRIAALEADLLATCKREAATQERHDAKMTALEAERDRYLRHLTAGAKAMNTLTAERDALAAQLAEAVGALAALLDLNDNHGPFGGEMYQDRVDRTWESARATLAKLEAKT